MTDFSDFTNFGGPAKQETPAQTGAQPIVTTANQNSATNGDHPLAQEDAPPESPDLDRLLVPMSLELASTPDFRLIGQDKIVRKIEETLTQKGQRRNVLLYGASGVGKDAIVLGLEQRKQQGNVSINTLKRTFWQLNTAKLFETDDSAEITKQFKGAIEELSAAPYNVLAIENAQHFISQIKEKGANAVLNGLVRAVEKKQIQLILTCTTADKAELLKSAPELAPLLMQTEVPEPSKDELLEILRGVRTSYETRYGVEITDASLKEIATLTRKYPGSVFEDIVQPSKALALLDSVISSFSIRMNSRPAELGKLEHELTAAQDEMMSLDSSATDFDKVRCAKLAGRIAEIEPRIQELRKDWERAAGPVRKALEEKQTWEAKRRAITRDLEIQRQNAANPVKGNLETVNVDIGRLDAMLKLADQSLVKINERMRAINLADRRENCVTPEHVQATFSDLSDIEVGKLSESEGEAILHLDAKLGERVFSQPQAIKAVVGVVKRDKAGLSEPGKPKGKFLFLGPSGVGKTELLLALAEELTKDSRNLKRIDMSEFMEKASVSRLIGAPPGYAGYDEGGVLTNHVMKRPKSVLLFDEVEKAHQDVFNVLLQVLDAGRLTSGKGETVEFGDTYVGLTSNIGTSYFLDDSLTFEEQSAKAEAEVRKFFRPELLGRLDGIVCFQKLPVEAMEKVGRRRIQVITSMLAEGEKKITLDIPDEDINRFARDHMDPKYGARSVQTALKMGPEIEIADYALTTQPGGKLSGRYDQLSKAFEFNATALAAAPACPATVPPTQTPASRASHAAGPA